MALLSPDNSQKLTHQFCHYRQGSPQANCATCHHYTGDGCEIVQDPIMPDGVCDFFVQRQGGGLLGGQGMMGRGQAV